MNSLPVFDIFSGSIDRDTKWVCSVGGLASAVARMNVLADKNPGKYFVFFALEHSVLAIIDTTHPVPQLQLMPAKKRNAG